MMLIRLKELLPPDTRRGSALIVVMLVVTVLMILSSSLFQVGRSMSNEVLSELDGVRARYLARAGVADAVASIIAGNDGSVGSIGAPAEAGGGFYWVERADLGNGEIRVRSTALVGSGRAALEVVFENPESPFFKGVLNSKLLLVLASGCMADSYSSSVGTYASQVVNVTNGIAHAGMEGDLASNDNIVVNANVTVFGDVTPGVTGSVALAPSAYVSGSTAPALVPHLFAPLDIPVLPAPVTSLIIPNGGSQSLASGDYSLNAISIGKIATLNIEGPANIVVDDFTALNDANLIIDATAGPVSIYVRGTYTHGNGFEANAVAGSPLALGFFLEGTDPVVFPSNTRIRGAYYAPNAPISFNSGNEAWGAFVGETVQMNAAMRFHFDEDLANYWQDDSDGFTGNVIAMYPTDVRPAALVRDRRDPRVVLQLGP